MSTARRVPRGAAAAARLRWVAVAFALGAAPGCYGGPVDEAGVSAQGAMLAPEGSSALPAAVAEPADVASRGSQAAAAPNDMPDPVVLGQVSTEPPRDVLRLVREIPPDAPETIREPEPFPWYWAYDDERGWHLVPPDVQRTVPVFAPAVSSAVRP